MELMVMVALGIVGYCGYLTMKDLIADLRQEGVLGSSPAIGRDRWSSVVLRAPGRKLHPFQLHDGLRYSYSASGPRVLAARPVNHTPWG
jgi:hypothetical protein